MGHVEISHLEYYLPDGRVLFDDASFRVGEGAAVALVGANGAGKTTLLRMIAGDLQPHGGSVTISGGLGVMRQFVGTTGREEQKKAGDEQEGPGALPADASVRDLLVSVAPARIAKAARAVDAAELAMIAQDDEKTQMGYAQALSDWADVGGYDYETDWDVCTTAALGMPFDKVQWRGLNTLSGGEQKRLVLEALLRGPEEVLLLDEPDNYLDVPGKRWLEEAIRATPKTVLFISHDRELLSRTAEKIISVESGAAGLQRLGARRRVRLLPRGPQGPLRALRGAAPPLGRGARQAQEARRQPAPGRLDQPRHGLPLRGRADQAQEVRGQPARPRRRRASRASPCGSRAGAPECAPSPWSSWSSPA